MKSIFGNELVSPKFYRKSPYVRPFRAQMTTFLSRGFPVVTHGYNHPPASRAGLPHAVTACSNIASDQSPALCGRSRPGFDEVAGR